MRIKTASGHGQIELNSDRWNNPMLVDIPLGAKASSLPFRLKNILVPIDFSNSSKRALRYARSLGKQFGARLILLHVVERRLRPKGYLIVPPEREAGSAARMNEREARLANLSEREIRSRSRAAIIVQMGEPWEEIVNLAKRRHIDLIILATRGLAAFKHALLGSTAERVVRHAPCPVLVVRENGISSPTNLQT